jgi:hypothetical protein
VSLEIAVLLLALWAFACGLAAGWLLYWLVFGG